VKDIYLDHNASTQPESVVVEAMLPFLGSRFGNANSSHGRGRSAAGVVAEAAREVSQLLGCAPSRLTWTSGATEGLNTAIKGMATMRRGTAVVASRGEHKAVLDTLGHLDSAGTVERRLAALTSSGEPDYAHLEALIDDQVALVCLMAVNNETGVMTDLSRVASLAHAVGALFLCDATQQVGKLPVNLHEAGVDIAVASAHKLYGPQGVGVLVGPPSYTGVRIPPLIHGGGHQGGMRSGTLNLPGIVGFGVAAKLASEALADGEPRRLAALRDRLEALLEKHAGPITVHGQSAPRLPNTVNVRIHGVDSEALLANCPEVAMSTGSACTSAVPHPSHVLTAMGLSATEAEESIRLSLGRYTTEEEIDCAAEFIGAAARRIRELNA
jgi:cysteine desulfurase